MTSRPLMSRATPFWGYSAYSEFPSIEMADKLGKRKKSRLFWNSPGVCLDKQQAKARPSAAILSGTAATVAGQGQFTLLPSMLCAKCVLGPRTQIHANASALCCSGDRRAPRCGFNYSALADAAEEHRTIMVVSSNKDSPTVLRCLYLIKRAWNKPNSSNSGGKHRECYYRRPDNQDICLQYLCYQTTA
ncbi:hypothetical protein Bbelb_160760 [Branchiostoma belcheri]|nr:hypothetical protein Bbelb_160760 [Branchiostoma belcheri]